MDVISHRRHQVWRNAHERLCATHLIGNCPLPERYSQLPLITIPPIRQRRNMGAMKEDSQARIQEPLPR
ncbi:hypothetical protein BD309DRAFT_956433 [Dichomitus squalens]|nr:hypothetical protein BD309DRAFT_956433 [Dichomitus squalens]